MIHMMHLLMATFLGLSATSAAAQDIKFDQDEDYINFEVNHVIFYRSATTGYFFSSDNVYKKRVELYKRSEDRNGKSVTKHYVTITTLAGASIETQLNAFDFDKFALYLASASEQCPIIVTVKGMDGTVIAVSQKREVGCSLKAISDLKQLDRAR